MVVPEGSSLPLLTFVVKLGHMFPNQQMPPSYPTPQQPQAPMPVDYLNQIAPQTPQIKPSKLKKLIIIGIIVTTVVLGLVITVNIIAGAQRKPMEQIAARMQTTADVADDSQGNLKSSELRGLNTELRVYFTNANRDIAAPFATVDITVGKLDKGISNQELATTTAMSERLEDARLNAIFDRTYAREMAYQLETLLVLMQQVYGSTKSPELKEYIKASYDNLVPMYDGFSDYNESTN